MIIVSRDEFLYTEAVNSAPVTMLLFRADILREMRIAKREKIRAFSVAIPPDVTEAMVQVIINSYAHSEWSVSKGAEGEGCLRFSAS